MFEQRRREAEADPNSRVHVPYDISLRRLQALFLCYMSVLDLRRYVGDEVAGSEPPVIPWENGPYVFVKRGLPSILVESEDDSATSAARAASLAGGNMPLGSVVAALVPEGSYPEKAG